MIARPPDLFDEWRVTGAVGDGGYLVLWRGERVMARGSLATIALNKGFKYVRSD